MNTLNTAIACPNCDKEFEPRRKNHTHCSDNCRKKASRNTNRGCRAGENKKRSVFHYERAARLVELLYSVPQSERLGQMKHILSHIDHDAGLRNILTDTALLKAKPWKNGRKNIAQAASAYTIRFFGVSIQTYIKQVREGSVNEFHPVQRRVDVGTVPRLSKLRQVKCWHKLLHDGDPMAQEIADCYARTDDIVAEEQARADVPA